MNDHSIDADLPPTVSQRIAVLGHQLALFAEALQTLRSRVEKGRLPQLDSAKFPPSYQLPDSFTVTISVPERDPTAWQLLIRTAAWPDHRACALLHLPGLKRSWQGLLRQNVLADLWLRLPHCWLVDRAALPPHAALAGLGLARWTDLPRLRHTSDCSFALHFADANDSCLLEPSTAETKWQQAAERLAQSSPNTIVMEARAQQPATNWLASFAHSSGRWTLTDCVLSSLHG